MSPKVNFGICAVGVHNDILGIDILGTGVGQLACMVTPISRRSLAGCRWCVMKGWGQCCKFPSLH